MQSLSPGWRVLVPHSLSVGFASNLCSLSQHVIRARRSKHVVQKKFNKSLSQKVVIV